MLDETLSTILFLIAIPIVQQVIKYLRDRKGKTIGKLGNQLVAFGLAAGALAISGGFLGIPFPELPVLVSDDLMASVPLVLEFLGAAVAYLGVLWAIVSGLYEVVFDRLFTVVGFATEDKYLYL